jgi:hypothetical protein
MLSTNLDVGQLARASVEGTMNRWIARLLVLIMVAPVFGPLALARDSQLQSPHCLRQPSKPVMECHHGMTMAPEPQPTEPQPTETYFRSGDQCCLNHDCCRGMAAPQWARPQTTPLTLDNLSTERAPSAPAALLIPSVLFDSDSARAPPRS